MAASKQTDNQTPKGNEQNNVQMEVVNRLLEELEAQRDKNKAMEEKIDILMKSGDKNKIKANTPKLAQLPTIRVTTWNDEVVLSWSKMTKNKVHINDQGMKVEQSTKIKLASGEEIDLEYEDFYTNKGTEEVQSTKVNYVKEEEEYFNVEDKKIKTQTVIKDATYHFDYNGKTYQINQKFINY